MTTDTIIVAPLHVKRAVPSTVHHSAFEAQQPRVFRIRSADTYAWRQAAGSLLRERYAWRGYQAVTLPADQTSNRITLTATEGDSTIGTITIALDGPEGLSAEDAFGTEIEALREAGQRICEFTKLAIDPDSSSKCVLAALFHVGYIVAHKMRGYDLLVMEVNPRHVRYYQRMLGASVLGERRLNRSVNAPAVLLSIPFDHIGKQILALGGKHDLGADERTLYPYAFSHHEEQGIIDRLMVAQKPASTSIN